MKVNRSFFISWVILSIPAFFIISYFDFKDVEKQQKKTQNRKYDHVGEQFSFENMTDSSGRVPVNPLDTDITIIDFWFTTCRPCIAEMQQFEGLLQSKDQQFKIISVSIESRRDWEKLFSSNNQTFPFLHKKNPRWTHLVFEPGGGFSLGADYVLFKYSTNVYPCYLVLDKTGKIIDMPNSAVNYINYRYNGKSPFWDYLKAYTPYNGFFYSFFRAFIIYSGFFWTVIFLILLPINFIRSKRIRKTSN
jgi:cytochrome oxidase Cu insertion factor (SCO1/SenC/PrrC family)